MTPPPGHLAPSDRPGRNRAADGRSPGACTRRARSAAAALLGVEGRLAGAARTAARSVAAPIAPLAAAVVQAGGILGETAGALATPTGLAGAAVEALWLGTHLAIYPLGLVGARTRDITHGYRIEHLGPVQRGLAISNLEAAGTPILLLHGMADNRSVFTLLRLGLRRRGFGRVTTMNYSILTGDIRTAAVQLAEEVEAIVAETGYERIHVVGHSMGGLIARYYVTRLGGDERVHTLVTLGSPHQGTYLAYGWPSVLTRQLRPGSPLMQELAGPVRACRTRFLCYWSDIDQLMFPQRTAALEHPDLNVTNVEMHGVGHMSLPIMQSVVHGISTALAHLDADGTTVTPGAAPFAGRRRIPT
ncbi:MAG: alpha/beta fold hydrolase [Lapillicoccus sp.]